MASSTRRAAIRLLRGGHAELLGLIDGRPWRQLNRRGIGRDDWSPKDVVGHLATWERFALEALDAWDRDRGWARESDLWSRGVSRTNVAELERARRLSAPVVLARAAAAHDELVARLEAMSDARWRAPATSRGRRPLGERLGGILVGPAGPFRHDEAHLRELRPFLESMPRG